MIALPGRPPLALLVRAGDPAPAFAVAVSTEGVAESRSPEVALALATLLEERVKAVWPGVEPRPAWDGFELRGLLSEASVGKTLLAADAALRAPVADKELDAVRRKLGVLSKKPLPDLSMRDLARCRGETFAISARPAEVTTGELERWRAASFGLGRVAFAVVGGRPATDEATSAARQWSPLSPGARAEERASSPAPLAMSFVEAPGLLPPRALRGHVIVRSSDSARAVAAARKLGEAGGPLLARLEGLESAPRATEIVGTASLSGGCIAVGLELGAVDLAASSTSSRVATALALTMQEIRSALAETTPAPSSPSSSPSPSRALARQASDPRDAAERAALWTLVETRETTPLVAPVRDDEPARALALYGTARDKPTPNGAAAAIEGAMERATRALSEPVVAAKTRVEPGQAELWLLFASPCGTRAEIATDAGFAAAFTLATAEPSARVATGPGRVTLEPHITPDALGLIAHGPALPGESPLAHARRIADAAARAFGSDPLDEHAAARVRASLRARALDPRARALFAVADAASPGRPSWLFAEGNPDALARVSGASLASRAAALREGPLRAAVLANTDETQAAAAVRALDRWIARRPEGVRACPVPSAAPPPRPGTYAIEAPGIHEAYVAVPVPEPLRDATEWVADVLSGDVGLLRTAVLDAGLAKTVTARVVGGALSTALVVHVAATESTLDGAMAQVLGLFDRLRRGALTDADVARAVERRSARGARLALDPRERLTALFADRSDPKRSPPALANLNAAAATLKAENMIVVAIRPPRPRAP